MFPKSPTTSCAVAMLCGLVASPDLAQAKTFRCDAGDVPCLINAIHQANASRHKHEIRLKKGTYTLTTVNNDVDGPNGLPSIVGRLTIEGEGASRTTIVGGVDSGIEMRVLHVAASGVVVLKDLVVRGGYLDGFDSPLPGGAGILNRGNLVIRDAVITDNLTVGCSGAGVRNLGTLKVEESTLSANVSLMEGGAALDSTGTLTVTESRLIGNWGDFAGAVMASGSTTIVRSSLSDNGGLLAGAVLNDGAMTIDASSVVRNQARWVGGLTNGDAGSALTMTNSTVAENVAESEASAGVSNEGGAVTITNSTIARNIQTGAPFLANVSAGIGNMLPWGGTHGTVELVNSIVALNTMMTPPVLGGGGPDCGGAITSRGTNLIGTPTDCGVALQAGDLTGDPGLGALVDDGTPGEAHMPLLPGSQAIDAANDDASPRRDQLDQRRTDIRRIGSSRGDIGAVEFSGR